VLETGDRPHLAAEPVENARTLDYVGANNLEHLVPSHDLVVGEVRNAHATAPELADDLIIGVFGQLGGHRAGWRLSQ
jgi:hypothetical protein